MKKKLVMPILLSIFLLIVGTEIMLTVKYRSLIRNNQVILGSDKYVKNIEDIAEKLGNRNALSVIMFDVDKNPEELDSGDTNNLLRFHELISTLIYKIGYVDKETHYFRNKLNRSPKTLKELIRVNKILPITKRWRLLSISNSSYHIQGVDGQYRLKFLSYDGFYEAVYNKEGVLLDEANDPVNMGTYNYAPGIPLINAHEKFDVNPYFVWGNTPNSPQKGKINIDKGVLLGLMNYKQSSLSVYSYRENLFGMQQGIVP